MKLRVAKKVFWTRRREGHRKGTRLRAERRLFREDGALGAIYIRRGRWKPGTMDRSTGDSAGYASAPADATPKDSE